MRPWSLFLAAAFTATALAAPAPDAADPLAIAVAAPADPTALPAYSMSAFLDAVHRDDYATAARYLDTRGLPEATRAQEGERLARRLRFVLDRALWIDFAPLEVMPAGPTISLGAIPLAGRPHDIRLVRVDREDATIWQFDARTVRKVDALFAAHGTPWMEQLPPFLFRRLGTLELWQWLALVVLLGVAVPLTKPLARLVLKIGFRAARFTESKWDDQLLEALRLPLRFAFIAVAVAILPRVASFTPPAKGLADVTARSMLVVSVAWFLLRFLKAAAAFVEKHVSQQADAGEGKIRALRTQLSVLRHVLEAAIYLVAASVLLLQFESVRSVGVSLLASAGIAGLVIGLAAQKTISSLLAGVQLSITQPIRIGDTVIIENEWGWIEEITLTYVVVKVWDLRRLVVPITHFLEKPFQNWSKVTPDILGTVFLHADYRTDLGGIRAELKRILDTEAGPLWDGKVQGMQITDCTERTMTVRLLVSSPDAGKNWDLRCLVRERMIEYLQKQSFGVPVLRAEAMLTSALAQSAEAPFPELGRNELVTPPLRAP